MTALAARSTRTTTTRTTATGTTAATSAAIAKVARRSGELPADTGTRHLTAARTIVFLLLFLGGADLEAAETARLVAIAATTEATRATATAAATALAATTALTAATAIVAVATTARRTGDAIDHVVKLAARDRAMRARFALEHTNQAHLVDPVADDVERLDETRGTLRLNVERCGDRRDRGFVLWRRCGLRRFTAAFAGRLGGRLGGGLGGRLDALARALGRRFRGRLASIGGSGFGRLDRRRRLGGLA
jgi:hypothetical protein